MEVHPLALRNSAERVDRYHCLDTKATPTSSCVTAGHALACPPCTRFLPIREGIGIRYGDSTGHLWARLKRRGFTLSCATRPFYGALPFSSRGRDLGFLSPTHAFSTF